MHGSPEASRITCGGRLSPKIGKQGFTLIEMLIVVIVAGILVSVAVPSYMDYVKRGRRADAKSVLSEVSNWLERNYSTNGCYNKTTPSDCAAQTGSSVTLPYSQAPKVGTANYTVSATYANSGQSYSLSAAPTAGHADAECGTLSVSQAGVQSISGTGTVSACWQK